MGKIGVQVATNGASTLQKYVSLSSFDFPSLPISKLLSGMIVYNLEKRSQTLVWPRPLSGFHEVVSMMFDNKTVDVITMLNMIANDISIVIIEIRPLVGDTNII